MPERNGTYFRLTKNRIPITSRNTPTRICNTAGIAKIRMPKTIANIADTRFIGENDGPAI